MKKALFLSLPLVTGLLLLAVTTPSFAAEGGKGRVRTITGEGMCAKCALKKSDSCQNVVQVERNGRTITYWLTGDVSKKFHHDNLCQAKHKVTATGTVKRVEGKLEMEVTEIKLAD